MYLEQITSILEELKSLEKDLQVADSNATAAKRVRVKTIELEKEFKSFRKNSIKHFKELKGVL